MKFIKKITFYFLIPLGLLSTLIVGCEDDDTTTIVDNTIAAMAKTINGVKFVNGIENVNINATIEIIFSHTLKTDLLSSSLTFSSTSGAVDYTLDFSNTNSTITIIPTSSLDYETTYTLMLPAGDYGLTGESLEASLSLSFTTAAFVPPVLSLSSDVTDLEEDGSTAIITAGLDKVSQDDVTATIVLGGTASEALDYNVNGSLDITIPAGSTSATISLTTIVDGENEGDETISLSLSSVVNANSDSQELTILLKEQLPAISLKGIMALTWDGSGSNDGKAIHLIVNQDIADLSIYGLGVANNGGGTNGIEYTFPAQSVSAGDDILVAREPTLISAYFGGCNSEFEHILQANTSISQNGDDAIELFSGTTVIETYGDADIDGTGEVWEYSGSWAYKFNGTWTYGGIDCSIGSTTSQGSACVYPICSPALTLQGIMAISWDGSGTNGGKAVHLKAQKNIADLSLYSIGVANNGGGTDGIEFTFPVMSVSEGDDILLAREQATIAGYFGSCINSFEHIIETGSMNQNGDDAIELFQGNDVIETYGDANVDGTGQSWDYEGSWGYKLNGNWITGGIDCAAGSTSTQSSACVYPACN
ncbi:Ig-like domain-containing protein [Flavivirga sp. 57AJ16]|uniref:Ig-like domain-containing protein n=1 Tax=Flavivirga sp. 57AJ16 TaxID=3025307 RepID=UPI002366BEB3|nr:Ig-like domain-containing protein [Flavivirga sp. 57AJ16]MDD7886291.1 Ig-like domain-containing protein [Flavivirga sp. 57AJ16]